MSLVASTTVAATIIATHQVAQRFASGAVGAYTQQQAYILAQKSLALAGLMIHRNIVLCSARVIDPLGKRVEGCDVIDPSTTGDLKAKELYEGSLNLDAGNYFTKSLAGLNEFGETYLEFNAAKIRTKTSFKNAYITWRLMSLKNSNLRSISGPFNKDYVCRDKKTFAVRDDLVCDPFHKENDPDRSKEEYLTVNNRESRLFEDKPCKDSSNTEVTNTVCDYYVDTDGDGVIVFISVSVPYTSTDTEEEETKNLVVNAAIRRPMSVVKLHVEGSSMCPISCATEASPDRGRVSAAHPQCVGFASGEDSGGSYFPDNIHASTTNIKVKNYGPGVLHDIAFLKEDIDPRTGLLLGKSMVKSGATGFPLEPHNADPSQAGEVLLTEKTPCYGSNFYKPALERVTCDCETSTAGEFKNTSRGVLCLKDKSLCKNKSIFANGVSTLEGSEARMNLSGCLRPNPSSSVLPATFGSYLTAFEFLKRPYKSAAPGKTEFTRIDNDQAAPLPSPRITWCGNQYADAPSLDTKNPTGRQGPVNLAVPVVDPATAQDRYLKHDQNPRS